MVQEVNRHVITAVNDKYVGTWSSTDRVWRNNMRQSAETKPEQLVRLVEGTSEYQWHCLGERDNTVVSVTAV